MVSGFLQKDVLIRIMTRSVIFVSYKLNDINDDGNLYSVTDLFCVHACMSFIAYCSSTLFNLFQIVVSRS